MSADNGIYILKTPVSSYSSMQGDGFEYRVAHMQAAENLSWDDKKHCHTENLNVRIKNAREMWEGEDMFHSEEEARKAAIALAETISFLEYGICLIEINREF